MPSSLSQAPKPPKPKTIKPIKPQSSEHMRVTQLKANVGRQKDALMRERENQKRQRDAEHRWRNLGLTEKHAEFLSSDQTDDRLCRNGQHGFKALANYENQFITGATFSLIVGPGSRGN